MTGKVFQICCVGGSPCCLFIGTTFGKIICMNIETNFASKGIIQLPTVEFFSLLFSGIFFTLRLYSFYIPISL